jgi:menaquinone-dependent protoporphyrinogen oxidase
MRVLVTAASRHGATMEVARAIADVLRDTGLDTSVHRPEDVDSVDAYDVVIVGSAVYMGRWMSAAREFVERNADALRARSVWIFSTGPIGDPLKPAEEPADVATMLALSGARDHRLFGGRLDKGHLGFGERTVVRLVGAGDGDYRPWDDIAAWASMIARALTAAVATPATATAPTPG